MFQELVYSKLVKFAEVNFFELIALLYFCFSWLLG